jgi:hypothetical protein
MAYNFPNSPSNGDTVTVNGIIYTYISADNAWKTGTGQTPAILSDGSTPTLGSGITAAEIRTLIGSVDLSSVSSDIIPDGDGTRDLGSSSAKFKDLHLSGNTLHLGAQTLEADSSSIILSQLKIGTGSSQVTLSGGAGGTLETGGSTIFSGVFADLTSKPNTISGYGITDAFDGVFASLSSKPTTIAGYGITDALTLGTTSTTALAGNTTIFSGVFADLTSKPNTISGYGITDAFSGAFSALTGKPTTIAGYGITDALTTGADADIGSNDFITTGKVYFANMFSQTSNLPSATTYHGMFAHVHATGAAYFAHGGNWIELANKSYVDTQVSALVDSAPATLNTLNELAAALNDDANFATTVTTSLGLKAPLASPALTGVPTAPTAASSTNTTQIATTAFVTAAVAGASGTYNNAAVDTHLNTGTASTNEVLSWNGSDYDWVAQSGGGGGASVTTSDAAPSSPSAGDLWYNTNAGGLFVYYTDANSSQWVEIVGKTGATGAAGGATVSVSDAAPSSPTAGQLWWNSSVNKLYIYYTDANSSQWVQATTPGADGADGGNITRYANVAGFPGSPTAADLAYANDTNTLYLYNGTAWEVVASGNDESPVILTEPPTTTQALNNDGTTSTVTMVAQDPEGFAINYGIAYKTANNALPSQLASAPSINQSTGVYTFTPTTTTSNAGNFRARLSASDGARTTTRLVDFSLAFAATVDYLVVAGGGGGQMGGGGGGGVLQATGASLQSGTSYAITVGAGGDGWKRVNGSNLPTRGGSSIIAGIATAIGGGAGGGNPGNLPTNEYQSGGSGGGAGHSSSTSFSGGKGIYPGSTFLDQARQGYDGGANKPSSPYGQGGGGGAGGAGGSASGSNSGNGGAGVVSSITGSNVTYAGGGGGGGWAGGTTAGSGGSGGGGAGSTADGATASNGTAGLGSGGGGGSIGGSGGPGGYGGSGVVIIRTLETAASTTGSPTVTTDGSYNIYKFTSDGSITF